MDLPSDFNDTEWMTRGACLDKPPRLFTPDERTTVRDLLLAKSICNDCPVKLPCRNFGFTQEAGIWGGLTKKERDDLNAQSS